MKEKTFKIKEGGHSANIKIKGFKYALYESNHYGRFILSVMDFHICVACGKPNAHPKSITSHYYKFNCDRGWCTYSTYKWFYYNFHIYFSAAPAHCSFCKSTLKNADIYMKHLKQKHKLSKQGSKEHSRLATADYVREQLGPFDLDLVVKMDKNNEKGVKFVTYLPSYPQK